MSKTVADMLAERRLRELEEESVREAGRLVPPQDVAADGVVTAELLALAIGRMAVYKYAPVPLAVWFVDRADAYRDVEQAFMEIARNRLPNIYRMSINALASILGVRRMQWGSSSPLAELGVEPSKFFLPGPGIWLEMSDGEHVLLSDDYFYVVADRWKA